VFFFTGEIPVRSDDRRLANTAVGLPQSQGGNLTALSDIGQASSSSKTEGEDPWTPRQSGAEEILGGRTGGEKVIGEVQLDMTSAGPTVRAKRIQTLIMRRHYLTNIPASAIQITLRCYQ
jgi:hypothetical protein